MHNKVYQLRESEDCKYRNGIDDGELYYIVTIDNISENMDSKKRYESLTLKVNRNIENFKLDTGSHIKVLSLKNYQK